MIRVNIVVEGPTEEDFVNDVLAPVLWVREVYAIARVVGTAGHQGGHVTFERVRNDSVLFLKQERTTYCTTLIDYYGLGGHWPGMPVAEHQPTGAKARALEQPLWRQVVADVPDLLRADVRFRPYLQMHEFEGLLFSDPNALAIGLDRADLQQAFAGIRAGFSTPEEINNSRETAPSKRIIQHFSAYEKSKPFYGILAALNVGLGAMRAQCPRFNAWVTWLERLGQAR